MTNNNIFCHRTANLRALTQQPFTRALSLEGGTEHRIENLGLPQITRDLYPGNRNGHRLAAITRMQVSANFALHQLVDANKSVAHRFFELDNCLMIFVTRAAAGEKP
jgi:hypothetical protein